jgi:post-segregation antitoxin (ccd killing protein)
MKTKLTLTVDRELLPAAKRYARERGVSLSSLVESALREMTGSDSATFAERWQGRMVLSERGDDRYRALAEKYR